MTPEASILVENFSIKLFFLCLGLGVVGQALRFGIGMWKIYYDPDPAKTIKAEFNKTKFIISLVLGGTVGSLLSLVYTLPMSNMDIFGCIAGAYGGADFLEGLLKKRAAEIK